MSNSLSLSVGGSRITLLSFSVTKRIRIKCEAAKIGVFTEHFWAQHLSLVLVLVKSTESLGFLRPMPRTGPSPDDH